MYASTHISWNTWWELKMGMIRRFEFQSSNVLYTSKWNIIQVLGKNCKHWSFYGSEHFGFKDFATKPHRSIFPKCNTKTVERFSCLGQSTKFRFYVKSHADYIGYNWSLAQICNSIWRKNFTYKVFAKVRILLHKWILKI